MEIGHNNPPSMIETAGETAKAISDWMAECPVIETAESAREAKVFLDRGKLCLKDLDDERDGKVRPLNEKVKEINETYRSPRGIIQEIIRTLNLRLLPFITEEKRIRIEAAKEAARISEEAEQKARDAERDEQDALGRASSGELGIDIASLVAEADSAFREFEKAERAAAIAEKETKVKIGGGFSRSISLRKKETLSVINPAEAITEIGLTKDIAGAIIKGARAFKKLIGRLPRGISSEMTEEL